MRRLGLARSLFRIERLRSARWGALLLLIAGLAGQSPAQAADFQIEGRIKQGYGWSGNWWPMLNSQGAHLYDTQGAFTPLLKYGQLTGDYGPLEWERAYKFRTPPGPGWEGHCDGWAASSVSEPEPTRPVRVRLQVGSPVVDFNVGEIKGLLAACYSASPTDFFSGARHDSGANSSNDLRAGIFHKAILYYLWQRQEGLVFNITPKPEVWNFPCFAFRMRGQTDPSRPEVTQVTTTIWYADDGVAPDHIGTKALWATYTYSVQGDWKAPQAAEWTGQSVTDHPQFAWHPAYAQAYDPNTEEPNSIKVDRVRQIAHLSAGVTGLTQ